MTESAQRRCSVLFERVPENLRSDVMLEKYFKKLMGEANVHSAVSQTSLEDAPRVFLVPFVRL